MPPASREARAGILAYLALTFGLSSIFYGLIIHAGHLGAAHGAYVVGLMWCPATAALIALATARAGDGVSGLGEPAEVIHHQPALLRRKLLQLFPGRYPEAVIAL
jgi:hypothetical protein